MMGKNLYSMCSYAYVYHIGEFLDKQSDAEIFLQARKISLNSPTNAIQIYQKIMNKIKR